MNYLTVKDLSKYYGARLLFDNITFHINQGDKVALVAKNGTGKSSLLRIIAGEEPPESGEIRIHKDVRLGYLPQEPNLYEDQTIFDAVYHSQNPIMKAMARYEKAIKNPDDAQEMQEALSAMDRLRAWDYDVKVKQILSKLEVDDMEARIGLLSGGQKKRVALAKVLIDEPQLIILDEPTNHLDLEMIEWLEDYLAASNLSLFMVTHDRYFLDAVCNEVIELDNQQVYKYAGNYAYFLEKKSEREENHSTVTERAQQLYKKELDWMRRQPKARGTKAKARVDSFYDLEEKAKQKVKRDKVELDIKMQRMGSKIIELYNVSKAYGDKVLIEDFSYKFKRQDRAGIVGRNGSGKTTLLNMITGSLEPDSGKVVVGDTVKIGYYTQKGLDKLKEGKRVIEVIRDIADYIPMHGGQKLSAEQLLERFLFDRKQQRDFVTKLSGGEKRRLHLLTVLMENPNFLILDEPTNDLDLMTLQVLEGFLKEFPGCILIVSHDRFFMDKIVEHTFALEGDGKVRDFPGNYSAYREVREAEIQAEKQEKRAENKAQKQEVQSSKSSDNSASKPKATREQRKEFRRIEKAIEKLERRKAEIHTKFATGTLDQEEMEALSQELGQINKEIDNKEFDWMQLADLM